MHKISRLKVVPHTDPL